MTETLVAKHWQHWHIYIVIMIMRQEEHLFTTAPSPAWEIAPKTGVFFFFFRKCQIVFEAHLRWFEPQVLVDMRLSSKCDVALYASITVRCQWRHWQWLASPRLGFIYGRPWSGRDSIPKCLVQVCWWPPWTMAKQILLSLQHCQSRKSLTLIVSINLNDDIVWLWLSL